MSRYVKLDSHGEMIDADDRLHAHWVMVYVDYDAHSLDGFTDMMAMCSNCNHIDGRYTFSYSKMWYRECPHCNAVMDGEVE